MKLQKCRVSTIGGAEQENTFNYSCEAAALKNSITKCYCKKKQVTRIDFVV